jgi:DNA-binding NarL/FixJ family response regulator
MVANEVVRSTVTPKGILIVDDHPLVRRGLIALIESEPGLAVVAEASSCRTALEAIDRVRPDLVIVDLALGTEDGLELIKKLGLRRVEAPVLVLSMYDESLYAERCLKAGAKGYITKGRLDEALLEAVRSLLRGETYLSDELQRHLVGKYVTGQKLASETGPGALTDRQLQVFRLIGEGLSTRDIAERLSLSIKTIESHREHIKNKLGTRSSTELIRQAIQWVESSRRSD